MKLYLASLGAGILVGIVYSLVNVRSPAPPVVALIGLFGILVGEQIVPVARHLLKGDSLATAIGLADCSDHVLGQLPGRQAAEPTPAEKPPQS
ncbi:XapX domain-containing protein [Xanthobacter dioxanivorans]|uniref:XapX domain-containing protein n=1 Tax=Xanthobacter dioxanivorans TaxID=2528964 RepID=A0A974PMJ6_9HYPH|nr:XapX domain-containing protein [Xanthobacter dioxanivorans]QRG06358.1 XapX domain-containing protein [Xanthobacter dioxanivorans]